MWQGCDRNCGDAFRGSVFGGALAPQKCEPGPGMKWREPPVINGNNVIEIKMNTRFQIFPLKIFNEKSALFSGEKNFPNEYLHTFSAR
jgi:hypothetical protein